MGIRLKVNGNEGASDRLFASVAGRRFPARIELTNTGTEAVEAELRIRPGAGATIAIADPRLAIGPGLTVETSIQAVTPSKQFEDTVLQVLVGGSIEAEFRFTVVSLARESVFHNLVPRQPA